RCVEQPAEPEPFCDRIRIRAYPCEEYLGLIFVYLGEAEAPPLTRFPEFEDSDEGVCEAYSYGTPWNMNVFNSLENDPFHGAWVQTLADLPPYTEVAESVLRGDFRIEDIADRHQHPDRLFNIQDYTSQVGQGRIPDRRSWHMGYEDTTVLMLQTIWRRELRNLAEGKPLKQWTRPEPL